MKVSIALHTDEPELDGNQRNAEARYQGYNRRNAVLVIDSDSNGICKIENLTFPVVQGSPDPTPYTHFSVGVCEGIDPGKGGAIIIAGPLPAPQNLTTLRSGEAPCIVDQLCGVYAKRIAEMRADGRMGPGD